MCLSSPCLWPLSCQEGVDGVIFGRIYRSNLTPSERPSQSHYGRNSYTTVVKEYFSFRFLREVCTTHSHSTKARRPRGHAPPAPNRNVSMLSDRTSLPSESLAAQANHCQLYLPKKRRYCRFECISGYSFCGHHLNCRQEDADSERIPCPLDPTHSIFKRELKKHLRICPRVKEEAAEAALPCFKRDCNAGEFLEGSCSASYTLQQGSSLKQSLKSGAAQKRLLPLIEIVRAAFKTSGLEAHPSPARKPVSNVDCSGDSDSKARGKRAEKHQMQHDGMVQVVQMLCNDRPDLSFVELGAGNGGLSYAVSSWAPRALYILIDWLKPQSACDALLRDRGIRFRRYKIDLRHFSMTGLPELSSNAHAMVHTSTNENTDDGDGDEATRCVPIAKHLCGCATDFALRSVVAATSAGLGQKKIDVQGIMIASCCHHKCTWGTYVNRPFFERLGFDEEDFLLLTVMSSWATAVSPTATAAFRPAEQSDPAFNTQEERSTSSETLDGATLASDTSCRAVMTPKDFNDEHAVADPGVIDSLNQTTGDLLDGTSRREIGRMCKRLLDTGRLRYLEQHGFKNCRLQMYVSEQVTPENVLLVTGPASTP